MNNKLYRASILNDTMVLIFYATDDSAALTYAQADFIAGGFKPYQLADLRVERYKRPKKNSANY